MASPKQQLSKKATVMATGMDRLKVKAKEHIRLHTRLTAEKKTAVQRGGKARTEWNKKARVWRDDRMVIHLASTALNAVRMTEEMKQSRLFTAEELIPYVSRLERSSRQMAEVLTQLSQLDLPNLPPLVA